MKKVISLSALSKGAVSAVFNGVFSGSVFFSFLCTTDFLSASQVRGVQGVQKGFYKPDVVYGIDDRLEIYQVPQPAILKLANSTAAVFSKDDLREEADQVQIVSKTFGQNYGLCESEPFADQPNAAFCSAFLIGPDLVATAGHCIEQGQCGKETFVFDYKMAADKEYPTTINKKNVYYCKNVETKSLTLQQDFAIVRLDRVVEGREPLTLASKKAEVNDELVMIGHPSGLPTKVSPGARVRRVESGFFVANTDSYGGNSGSAIFNAQSLEVVGILVRGEVDFVNDRAGQCLRSKVCKDDECRGEDATHIEFVSEFLKHMTL